MERPTPRIVCDADERNPVTCMEVAGPVISVGHANGLVEVVHASGIASTLGANDVDMKKKVRVQASNKEPVKSVHWESASQGCEGVLSTFIGNVGLVQWKASIGPDTENKCEEPVFLKLERSASFSSWKKSYVLSCGSSTLMMTQEDSSTIVDAKGKVQDPSGPGPTVTTSPFRLPTPQLKTQPGGEKLWEDVNPSCWDGRDVVITFLNKNPAGFWEVRVEVWDIIEDEKDSGIEKKMIFQIPCRYEEGWLPWGFQLFTPSEQIGKVLAFVGGHKETEIVLLTVPEQKPLWRLKGHMKPVVAFEGRSETVVSIARDSMIYVWNALEGTCIHAIPLCQSAAQFNVCLPYSITYSAEQRLVLYNDDNHVYAVHTPVSQCEHVIDISKKQVQDCERPGFFGRLLRSIGLGSYAQAAS